MSADSTLLVIAKEPRPGQAKTRLTPPCSPQDAARLARVSLAETLQTVARTPAGRRLLVLEGRPGGWLPDGFEVLPQTAGGLDERIAGALEAVRGPVVLVGMDTPQLTPALLHCDFTAHPAWLGPAEDGGFWALGLAEPDPALVRGVPMSTSYTCDAQRRRLTRAGLTVGDLPVLRDVDTWADALLVATDVPASGFGRLVREISARREAA